MLPVNTHQLATIKSALLFGSIAICISTRYQSSSWLCEGSAHQVSLRLATNSYIASYVSLLIEYRKSEDSEHPQDDKQLLSCIDQYIYKRDPCMLHL